MKLLLDQNLSPRLLRTIGDSYPGSAHVREFGLMRASDEEVWTFSEQYGLAITSKDLDFQQMSFVRGHPPKVVWLRVGNRTTKYVSELLIRRLHDVRAFPAEPEASFLSLG